MSVSSPCPWKTTAEALAFLNRLEISLWKKVKQQGDKTKSHSVSSKNETDVSCKPGSQALQVVRAKESQHVCERKWQAQRTQMLTWYCDAEQPENSRNQSILHLSITDTTGTGDVSKVSCSCLGLTHSWNWQPECGSRCGAWKTTCGRQFSVYHVGLGLSVLVENTLTCKVILPVQF